MLLNARRLDPVATGNFPTPPRKTPSKLRKINYLKKAFIF
jgi:hypothetical protein